MHRRVTLTVFLLVCGLFAAFFFRGDAHAETPSSELRAPARPLNDAERVACLTAIEELFWQSRLWPSENERPKPDLDTLLSPEMLHARVADTARQSNLLANYWNSPVTGAMLQAEMERMASETRQPEQLRALFAALDDDPALIAECLARPALVERLVRDRYSHDERIHGALHSEAVAAMASVDSPDDLLGASGAYQETTWELGDPGSAAGSGAIVLEQAHWAAERERLALWFGATPETLPAGVVSSLQEDDAGYFAAAVLEQSDTRLRVATMRWDKQPFEAWWARERGSYPEAVEPLSADYILPLITGETMGESGWLSTPSLPEANVRAVWTGAEMIVFGGGETLGNRTNSGWRYNPTTDSWLTISSVNAPQRRAAHTLVWTGTEIIAWGGCTNIQIAFCELGNGGRYNPVTGVWLPTSATNAPDPRLWHTAVWTGSEMIVWGGCAFNTNGTSCIEKNTGGRYDPATDSWVATSLTGAPAGRYHHTAVWTGSEMIVWGGEDGLNLLNSGGRYNPATNAWSPTSTANAPAPRMQHTAVWTGTEMIIWGGCPDVAQCTSQGNALASGGRYNPATDSWTPTSTTGAPSPRAEHTAVWTGSQLIVFGGVTSTFITFNTGGRYDPSTDSWTPTSTANAPAPRYSHVAVWTGSEMIVWGGATSAHRSGARYDPASDSWTATNDEDPVSYRSNHVAVWTGSEMIVWGGADVGAGSVSTGRIYNPALRTWRATPDSNLPGRENLTAVWTGTEMIVWGGRSGNWSTNTGGRFNPATNTWSPTSLTNAPSERGYPVSVWTGTEMIVWGGDAYPSPLNTGGRYNPATDAWTATSTSGAPSGRYLTDAVWTGSEMIVWGGYGGDSLNSGGRYNPATNSWLATSLTNAPDPRHWHTAVWTGAEMIVWGGVFFDTETNYSSGGRYNPATDSWQATNLDGAPSGRVRHTAIWTGAEMIVWGGCTGLYCVSGNALYTGGHYDPAANTWTPTAIDALIPRARGEHTAVWAGDRMIVWGGYTDLSTYTHTGAEYFVGTPPPTAVELSRFDAHAPSLPALAASLFLLAGAVLGLRRLRRQ